MLQKDQRLGVASLTCQGLIDERYFSIVGRALLQIVLARQQADASFSGGTSVKQRAAHSQNQQRADTSEGQCASDSPMGTPQVRRACKRYSESDRKNRQEKPQHPRGENDQH